MSITFVDSTSAATPLPSGISVTVTQGSTTIGTATTDTTGSVAIAITQGETYSASFSGPNAPSSTQNFIGGSNQNQLVTDSGTALTDDAGNPFVSSTGVNTTVPVAGYTTPATTKARVTQVALEVLGSADANARVTQVATEVLGNSPTNLRVTQVAIECLVTVVPRIISITVTPATSSVGDGEAEQFTATAQYDTGETVDVTSVATWTATYGTVSTSGLYTAPASRAGNDTISAEVNGVTGTATVTDVIEYSLVLTPRAISTPTNSQIQIVAILNGSDGSTTPVDASWSASAGGTIDQSGLFTAGPNPTSAVEITATYETYSATAVVTITGAIALLPASLAAQGIFGSISLDCPYGGDFTITPQGNLALAIDTPSDPAASRQRLYRLIQTNPTARDAAGNAVGRADDLFNPEYGSGARAAIGKPANGKLAPAIVAGIVARVKKAIAGDEGFSPFPAPIVTVSANGEVVTLSVSATTVTGQIVTIPSIPLSNGS